MKKALLLISALALFACANDPTEETSGGVSTGHQAVIVGLAEHAIAGRLNLKVTSEVADAIEAAAKTHSVPQTRSGIDDIDLIFNEIGVERFERIFPSNERFDARQRQYGLHQWYTVSFDSAVELASVAQRLIVSLAVSVENDNFVNVRLYDDPVVSLNESYVAVH